MSSLEVNFLNAMDETFPFPGRCFSERQHVVRILRILLVLPELVRRERPAAGPLDCRLLLTLLGAVLRSATLATVNAQSVEGAADDVIANARQVAHASATDEHDAVFLQIVLFAGNVGCHFLAIAQPDAGDF